MILGLDMGGTHIDGVIIKDGKVVKQIKRPTNRDDLFHSIWTSLEELLLDEDKSKIKRINLSTTVSTNAIVENRISPVGMIIQSGPGLNPDFLSCADENFFISGYVDHRGIEVEALDSVEIQRAKEVFQEKGIKSLGVVTKFSTRNPNHEKNIKKALGEDFNTITLGHRMSGNLNFPRRVFTSYLNSAVHNTFKDFADNIKKSLEKEGIDAPLFILKADGGTMDIETAEARPVETILSGPAASFMGISAMMENDNDSILLDIGGTTTDIFFLADGVPLFQPLGAKISKYNTQVRAIYSSSIGLGGDSSIRVEKGELVIGPRREGQAYAFGGPMPTPTDGMIFLDLIHVEDEDSKEQAKEAMEILGKDLDLPLEKVAQLIFQTMANIIKSKTDELLIEINSKPVYTVEELLHGKKIIPQSINIIGGPANILSNFLSEAYGLPCSYPGHFQVANAIGAALAKPTIEITLLADTAQGILRVSELGVYEKIPQDYSQDQAEKRTLELLHSALADMAGEDDNIQTEITQSTSFNMVSGFYTSGKNIRIRGQIKPGHILNLRSGSHDES